MPRIASESDSLLPVNPSLPSRWVTVPLGFFLGGLATAIAGAVLAFLLMVNPFSRLLGFDEFDALMVIGLPVLSFPGGAIGGAILGGIRKTNNAFAYSMLPAALLAGIFFLNVAGQHELSKNVGEQFMWAASCSVLMVVSAAAGLCVVAKILRLITQPKRGGLEQQASID